MLKGHMNVLTRFYCETLDLEKVQNVDGRMCASTVFQQSIQWTAEQPRCRTRIQTYCLKGGRNIHRLKTHEYFEPKWPLLANANQHLETG